MPIRAGKPLLSLVLSLSLAACATSARDQSFVFQHGENKLQGVLRLPTGTGPHPAVIFVHGDGPATWDRQGYYQPLKNALLKAGFATLSWDKPGVGGSSGNWLSQNMQDRIDETIAAAVALKHRPEIQSDSVGLWGVSQAGWVMPLAVSQSTEFAFMISVSGAINWLSQGRYFMRHRLQQQGYSDAEIRQAFAFEDIADAVLLDPGSTYEDYQSLLTDAPPCCNELLPRDRWRFVKLNIASDARAGLQHVRVPVLAIFGAQDRNVDFSESAEVYAQELVVAGNNDVTIRVFENADHSLLSTGRSALDDFFFGADSFTPGYIELNVNWLRRRFVATSHSGFVESTL